MAVAVAMAMAMATLNRCFWTDGMMNNEMRKTLNAYRKGRAYGQIRDELELHHEYKVSYDTVARWFRGEAVPSLRARVCLARMWRLYPAEVELLVPDWMRELAELAGWVDSSGEE